MASRKVAIFDVDGTIFRSSLLIQLVEQLILDGAFAETVQIEYEKTRQKWLDREGDYDAYVDAIVQAFCKHIKGVHYSALVNAADKMVDARWKQVYRYTRDLIPELKRQGYFLLAISHSPKTVLDKFCPKLGFDKAYGMIYEIGANDSFTGKVVDEHIILNKANILRRAVEKEGLTLKDSVGVGDTNSDIPFLEMVEKPICFNPNSKLYTHAKRQGWKAVVERKDVIYEL